MNKESQQEKKTEPEQQPEAPNKIRVEIEYNMQNDGMVLRAKLPTVLFLAVIRRASKVHPKQMPETAAGAPRRVHIDYDLKSPEVPPIVSTDAQPLIYDGIMAYAESMITQNQVMQRIQAMAVRNKLANISEGIPRG